VVASCLFVLVTVMAAGAAAETADLAAADALLREGKALLERKQLAEACPKLAESNRLYPAAGTLLALGTCHEAEGKTASAWAEYDEAANHAREEALPEIEKAARARRDAIAARLSSLSIVPSRLAAAAVGLYVQRDRVFVDAAALRAAVPVDPGEHRVEASAPGDRSPRPSPWAPVTRRRSRFPGCRTIGDSALRPRAAGRPVRA
jgi:tetratricopeptide (TPR) repeat protein